MIQANIKQELTFTFTSIYRTAAPLIHSQMNWLE